jgi:hypothetical protein
MELIKTENNNQHEIIEGIRLFRNDVDKIIETYTAEGYSLTFYDDEYKYESLNDYIENNGNIVKKLILLFRKEEEDFIRVNTFFLEGNTVTISTDNRIDLFTEIFEHLKKRKPFTYYHQWPKNLIFRLLIYIIAIVVITISFPEIEELKLVKENNDPRIRWYFLASLWIGGYLLLSFLIPKYYLRISLEKEHKTWIMKYRSEIIAAVIVAIFTFISTKLGG